MQKKFSYKIVPIWNKNVIDLLQNWCIIVTDNVLLQTCIKFVTILYGHLFAFGG